MATKSLAEAEYMERKPLKYGTSRTSESFVRAGQLVEAAILKAQMTRDEAAGKYGVTASLMQRQITNQDNQHLSFQRLWSMPLAFKLELVAVLLDDLAASGAPVKGETTYRIGRLA